MANETMTELQSAVSGFKEVVNSLSEISQISENVRLSEDALRQLNADLKEYFGSLTAAADKIGSLSSDIFASNASTTATVSADLREARQEIADSSSSVVDVVSSRSTAAISAISSGNAEIVKAMADRFRAADIQAVERAEALQSSIDQLRSQNSDGLHELRDKISCVKADLEEKAASIQKVTDTMNERSKADHIFVMLGSLSAVAAAVASIVSLFI